MKKTAKKKELTPEQAKAYRDKLVAEANTKPRHIEINYDVKTGNYATKIQGTGRDIVFALAILHEELNRRGKATNYLPAGFSTVGLGLGLMMAAMEHDGKIAVAPNAGDCNCDHCKDKKGDTL
jgi:hypothetical protein